MGKRLLRVPTGFKHPGIERDGPIPGAHLEILYQLEAAVCTSFQIYEDVTEGTPVSPVFDSLDSLKQWLNREGYSEEAAAAFIAERSAPSFVVGAGGEVVSGIDGLGKKSE